MPRYAPGVSEHHVVHDLREAGELVVVAPLRVEAMAARGSVMRARPADLAYVLGVVRWRMPARVAR